MPFVIVGVAAVVALAAVTAFLLLREPPLTFDDREIAEPEQVLADGEETIDGIVESRNGASNDATRCYFSLPEGESSVVDPFLRCGPVLFVDGDPDEVYLSLPFTARAESADPVALEVAAEPESPEPSGLDPGETLRRPDGVAPPEGAGGLEVPPPPPVEAGFFAVQPLDGIELEDPGADAIIVSFSRSYRLSGLGQPDRFGSGDEARRPADDERFVAFQVDIDLGEGTSAELPTVEVQVGADPPRPLPEAAPAEIGTVGMIISVPDDSDAVDLVVTEVGVQQRLSLLTGEPAVQNPSVLRRDNRSQTLGASQALPFTVSAPGFISESFAVTPTIQDVDLFWFFGANGTIHPADPQRAYLVVGVDYVWPPEIDPNTGLDTPFWTLTLPDGAVIGGVNVNDDPANLVTIAFDVPADFTDGTITVGGIHTFPTNETFDFGANQLVAPVSIPPG